MVSESVQHLSFVSERSQSFQTAPFSKLDGSSVDVAMMQQELEDGFYFAEIDGAQIAELPYVGEDLSMVVVVPEESDGLLALEAGLDASRVQGWFDALVPAPVSISMPKLEIRWKDTLNVRWNIWLDFMCSVSVDVLTS